LCCVWAVVHKKFLNNGCLSKESSTGSLLCSHLMLHAAVTCRSVTAVSKSLSTFVSDHWVSVERWTCVPCSLSARTACEWSRAFSCLKSEIWEGVRASVACLFYVLVLLCC
jgi:hypothetical protein